MSRLWWQRGCTKRRACRCTYRSSKREIEECEGKGGISKIAVRAVVRYSDKLLKITELIDDYAVVGGIQGMDMPVAVGF